VDLDSITKDVALYLSQREAMLATAESCTGGWVAQTLTSLAGSSAWFDAGFVTYSNSSKQRMLGVSESTLDQEGAVSEAVVLEMAAGACAKSDATYAIAISGVAGPGGGSAEKPVGTVWIGWSSPQGCWAKKFNFEGDRKSVRKQAVVAALQGLLQGH